MIRKANCDDIDSIVKIYNSILTQESEGKITTGWIPGIYPVQATAEASLKRGDLFVLEDNKRIVASAILNKIQVDTYYSCDWEYPAEDDEVLVIHTLVVDPEVSHSGYGKQFLRYYENLAKESGCKVLRLDTNSKNKTAVKFYTSNGYIISGVLPCEFNGIPDVNLVLFEKKIN